MFTVQRPYLWTRWLWVHLQGTIGLKWPYIFFLSVCLYVCLLCMGCLGRKSVQPISDYLNCFHFPKISLPRWSCWLIGDIQTIEIELSTIIYNGENEDQDHPLQWLLPICISAPSARVMFVDISACLTQKVLHWIHILAPPNLRFPSSPMWLLLISLFS